MSSKSSATSGGIGLASLVFLVFLVMKLAGVGEVKDWSWWWVTCPLWGGLAIALVVLFFLLIVWAIAESIKRRKIKERNERLETEDSFQGRLYRAQKSRLKH